METNIKLPMIVFLIALALANASSAAPRSRLSHDCSENKMYSEATSLAALLGISKQVLDKETRNFGARISFGIRACLA